MERTAIFLDVANLERAFRTYGVRIDYLGLRNYLAEGRFLVETFAYLPLSPYDPASRKGFINFLRHHGFFVRSKVGKPRPDNKWKCNFDVEMAVDILHYIHHARIDIIVIGSGDGDMLPVCEEIRWSGVRCEIASTKESLAEDLLGAASSFVDLGSVIVEQADELVIAADADPRIHEAPNIEETYSEY